MALNRKTQFLPYILTHFHAPVDDTVHLEHQKVEQKLISNLAFQYSIEQEHSFFASHFVKYSCTGSRYGAFEGTKSQTKTN